ncbi:hypothetical protein AAFF_G00268850 [Aldrovandia affinis]|uniref:Uncharacterized protein n=1 Tax=Aldrovandia affinis TaxID=143900 RepID=A0AAD7SU44_9TELE|nr:hypothetical protein AAFF_G00268850 [Aldrovandia affinis]
MQSPRSPCPGAACLPSDVSAGWGSPHPSGGYRMKMEGPRAAGGEEECLGESAHMCGTEVGRRPCKPFAGSVWHAQRDQNKSNGRTRIGGAALFSDAKELQEYLLHLYAHEKSAFTHLSPTGVISQERHG